jgi:hypothetical protein
MSAAKIGCLPGNAEIGASARSLCRVSSGFMISVRSAAGRVRANRPALTRFIHGGPVGRSAPISAVWASVRLSQMRISVHGGLRPDRFRSPRLGKPPLVQAHLVRGSRPKCNVTSHRGMRCEARTFDDHHVNTSPNGAVRPVSALQRSDRGRTRKGHFRANKRLHNGHHAATSFPQTKITGRFRYSQDALQ